MHDTILEGPGSFGNEWNTLEYGRVSCLKEYARKVNTAVASRLRAEPSIIQTGRDIISFEKPGDD